jgi:hypothetical protein
MTKNNSHDGGHPVDLLLPFMENSLDPAETATVKNHIEQCDHCAQELRLFEQITSALKTDKNVFCPEPWEIYEFVETGKDPGQKIANHLNECSLCRHEIEALKTEHAIQEMPKQIWKRLESGLPKNDVSKVVPVKKHSFWRLPHWSFSFLKIPVLATASAVAILCVVLLYPGSQPKLIVALSSEDWSHSRHAVKLMSPSSQKTESRVKPTDLTRPIAAIIVILDDPSPEFNSQRIDSLYQTIQPTEILKDKFEFVSPVRIKELINSGTIKPAPTKELLRGIKDSLNVSDAVIMTIRSQKGEFEIKGQLINTETGKVLKEKSETNINGSQLNARLRNISEILLLN